VYDRTFGDKALSFEPSGGLLEAALVMRDRETDSWWAIMRGRSIGGPMDGRELRELRELPSGEKTTWGDWRRRHPETLVLAVDGQTHVSDNHYDSYFSSGKTFRGTKSADDRLPAKEPIYAFRMDGRAYALTHRTASGGHLVTLHGMAAGDSMTDTDVFLFRERGASVFASTQAWQVPRGLITRAKGGYVVNGLHGEYGTLLRLETKVALNALGSMPGVAPLSGLDTYWYTWIAVNPGTTLLR